MKTIFTILISFCCCSAISQGDSSLPVIRRVVGDISAFTADNLGNLYLIMGQSQLKKLNTRGDSMGVFNDVKKYGKLYSLDATNPLKTVLFYRDFRTILALDRLMSVVNIIDLRKRGIFQVRAVALAYDNNFWVFDEQESKLKRLDEEGKLISETADLRLVFGDALVPVKMFDQNRFVYLYDPTKGMYIFDYYGALKNKLPLLNWTDVEVVGNTIFGRKDGKLMVYETGTLQLKETDLPSYIKSAEKIQISPLGIYVLSPGELRLFNIY